MDKARDVWITRGDGDFDGNVRAFDLNAFHEAKRQNIAAETRIADVAKGGADVLFGGHRAVDTSAPSRLVGLLQTMPRITKKRRLFPGGVSFSKLAETN
jgi:hypothetical protein